MKFRSAFAVLSMTVALAACGELPFQKAAEPEAPAHSGPPGVSPLEQPIETGTAGTAVATAEASTMNTAIFRAAGAGWTVSAADKSAVYERPGQKSVGVTVRRMTYARGVEFIGNMNGAIFALNIQAAECDAGGQKAPFTAKLRVGSQRMTGCAVAADGMPKAQVKASSASPKPKAVAKPKPPAAKPAEPKPAVEPEKPVETTPAATTTPATTTMTTAPATSTPAAPATAAPAEPATSPAVPDTAPATPVPASPEPATPAPAGTGATGGVPAPALVLPTPPAASE